MARIFFALAMFAVALLIANVVVGFSVGDFNRAAHKWLDAQHRLREVRRDRDSTEHQERTASENLQDASAELQPIRRKHLLHLLLGVAASLVTILVNSITVTYFIGTSRWCREVVDTYQLPEELAVRSSQLKRKTFPWALIGILTVILIVGLGGASDPSANPTSGSNYVMIHMVTSILGIALILWAFLVQVGNIGANYEIIEQILALVKNVQENADQA